MDNSDEQITDDLLPNEHGEAFYTPEEEAHILETNVEKAMVTGAAPIFTYILDTFDREIAASGTVDAIDLSLTSVEIQAQVLAAKYLRQSLTTARDHLADLRDAYIK